MKKLVFIVSILLSTVLFAQNKEKMGPPEGKALVGDFYGAQVSMKSENNALSTKNLTQKLKKSKKVNNVAIKGKVTEVCDKKGCWLTVETDHNEKLFVKMKDYGFFVPTALVGKNVVLEGDAETKVISVEEQKHYAEDAKKSEAEINAISKPQQEIRFVATGIKVVN